MNKKYNQEDLPISISLEINPPVDADFEKLRKKIDAVSRFIDFVNVTSCPMGRLRPSAIASANFIQSKCGVKAVVNVTCRDSNLLGLTSDLLGADILGIRNILAVTGDPAQSPSDSVFQTDVFRLIKLVDDMNKGKTFSGKIARKTAFRIGCATLVPPSGSQGIYNRLMKKYESGASFCITQPIYGVNSLEIFLEITESIKIDKIIGLMPLTNLKMAKYISENVPGIYVPDQFLKALEQNEESAYQIGIAQIKEIIEKAGRKGLLKDISGIHFMFYNKGGELLDWAKNYLRSIHV